MEPSKKPADPDAELVNGLRQRDARAQAALFHRYRVRVCRFCQTRGLNEADAEDVTARALERALLHIDRFAGRSWFRTWLFGIARNLSSLARGRSSPENEPVALEDCLRVPGSAGLEPEEMLRQDEQRQLVGQLLAVLTETERSAVVLQRLEQMPVREIARTLGRSEACIYQSLSRAMDKLRRAARRRRLARATSMQGGD